MDKVIVNMSKTADSIARTAEKIMKESTDISEKLKSIAMTGTNSSGVEGIDPFIFAVTIFILACFVGYYVVWKVTPALHTPLMAVTNAISGIIIVGAMIASGPSLFGLSQIVGFIAIVIASINIFGGFVVTQRMLEMFRKKKS